jgi:hypothetical protein
MKVTQWVDFGGDEVEVEIAAVDIVEAIRETAVNADSVALIQRSLVDYYQFLKAIPDEMIATLSPQARKIVHEALSAQAKRFDATGDSVSG